MEIRGTVVAIDLNATIEKKTGGTYQGVLFSYRDSKDNKLQEKAFHSNAMKFNKDLKAGFESLNAGDAFVVEAIKEGEYWNWKSIKKADANAPVASAPANKPAASNGGGNWATAEERAQTQVYIVRQSSLTNALKLLEIQGNKKATTADVIALAAEFEAFVMGKEVAAKKPALKVVGDTGPEDMDNDIPF